MTRLVGFARIAATAAIGIGLGLAARAEDWTGPHVVGTGENGSVEYATPSLNIVGGALSRSVGSGEGASIEVLSVEHEIAGHLSRSVGSGEGASLEDLGEHGAPTPSPAPAPRK